MFPLLIVILVDACWNENRCIWMVVVSSTSTAAAEARLSAVSAGDVELAIEIAMHADADIDVKLNSEGHERRVITSCSHGQLREQTTAVLGATLGLTMAQVHVGA